jgi:cobalt-zinc-cadmium efflux system protein
MKTERNILIAFVLNMVFAIFEFIGGIVTGSISILSDAVHDIGDATSIGISYLLERKSKKKPDANYTYGYARYSVVGSLITTTILIVGSCLVIYNAVWRILSPVQIDYDGMIVFAIIGVTVNTIAALVTRRGDSLNQKAVNLHMMEDVLGWIVVLVGAIIMRFTDIMIIDPIMSILVALFILINAMKHMHKVIDVFTEKSLISIDSIKNSVTQIEGVINVHHVHIWSMDGNNHYATMHVVTTANHKEIKEQIRSVLNEYGIGHVTLELESKWECCDNKSCDTNTEISCNCCSH